MTDYYGGQSSVLERKRRPISQLHSHVKMTDNVGAAGPLTGFIGP